jgi:hypothetical protein
LFVAFGASANLRARLPLALRAHAGPRTFQLELHSPQAERKGNRQIYDLTLDEQGNTVSSLHDVRPLAAKPEEPTLVDTLQAPVLDYYALVDRLTPQALEKSRAKLTRLDPAATFWAKLYLPLTEAEQHALLASPEQTQGLVIEDHRVLIGTAYLVSAEKAGGIEQLPALSEELLTPLARTELAQAPAIFEIGRLMTLDPSAGATLLKALVSHAARQAAAAGHDPARALLIGSADTPERQAVYLKRGGIFKAQPIARNASGWLIFGRRLEELADQLWSVERDGHPAITGSELIRRSLRELRASLSEGRLDDVRFELSGHWQVIDALDRHDQAEIGFPVTHLLGRGLRRAQPRHWAHDRAFQTQRDSSSVFPGFHQARVRGLIRDLYDPHQRKLVEHETYSPSALLSLGQFYGHYGGVVEVAIKEGRPSEEQARALLVSAYARTAETLREAGVADPDEWITRQQIHFGFFGGGSPSDFAARWFVSREPVTLRRNIGRGFLRQAFHETIRGYHASAYLYDAETIRAWAKAADSSISTIAYGGPQPWLAQLDPNSGSAYDPRNVLVDPERNREIHDWAERWIGQFAP